MKSIFTPKLPLLLLLLAGLWTGCKQEQRCDTSDCPIGCSNGGVCNGSDCICPSDYEGFCCEFAISNRHAGKYCEKNENGRILPQIIQAQTADSPILFWLQNPFQAEQMIQAQLTRKSPDHFIIPTQTIQHEIYQKIEGKGYLEYESHLDPHQPATDKSLHIEFKLYKKDGGIEVVEKLYEKI